MSRTCLGQGNHRNHSSRRITTLYLITLSRSLIRALIAPKPVLLSTASNLKNLSHPWERHLTSMINLMSMSNLRAKYNSQVTVNKKRIIFKTREEEWRNTRRSKHRLNNLNWRINHSLTRENNSQKNKWTTIRTKITNTYIINLGLHTNSQFSKQISQKW